VQCDDTHVIVVFGEVVKGAWLAATRIQRGTDFEWKRGNVLGIVAVFHSIAAALRLNLGDTAGDRQNAPYRARTCAWETNRQADHRAKTSFAAS